MLDQLFDAESGLLGVQRLPWERPQQGIDEVDREAICGMRDVSVRAPARDSGEGGCSVFAPPGVPGFQQGRTSRDREVPAAEKCKTFCDSKIPKFEQGG